MLIYLKFGMLEVNEAKLKKESLMILLNVPFKQFGLVILSHEGRLLHHLKDCIKETTRSDYSTYIITTYFLRLLSGYSTQEKVANHDQ